ncbi:Peptidoglycan-binding domain 1 protein [Desulfonatronospira thiodismutans ASO3-1]|uniref:Peptidoglycan-binding domain 1 protein n=1 Tax=Desulfonatronospira thiodismutans ASO3-1 TaxID=555779 RepID=D6SKP3_9BACT|nr:ExeA family protein [Desulfonatronospira thiodismutans]EFI35254.1 Peptidoglycan-binding domain 1 protein [Desulfonatronospira thiodismutans ASO3-1]
MPSDIFQAIGLKGNPFSPATSTKGYFHTQATQRILEEIHFGVSQRRGFLLLIGEVGVGKTSLLLQLLERIHSSPEDKLRSAWVFNSMMDRMELMKTIIRDYGLTPAKNATFSELLSQLHQFFLEVNSNGGNCAIIIDEAHNFDIHTLESLRLLSNLESDEKKLVQILLSGQPELQVRLNCNELRQLRSRIAISNTLPALSRDEVKRYVDFKLSSTSSQLYLPSSSCRLLHRSTRGNVRLINLIMERSLHAMYALDQTTINPGIVHAAIQEVGTFQQDIRQNYSFKKKILCAALILALVLPAAYLVKQQAGSPIIQGQDSAPQQQTGSGNAGTQAGEGMRTVEHDTVLQIVPDASVTREKLHSFLEPFDQENLAEVMLQALWVNSPEVLHDKLPDDLLLAGVHDLPDNNGLKFSAFPWKEYTGQSPKWIVLWRPEVIVQEFYPDLRSQEIQKIQERLSDLGYYRNITDGYLGSATWHALMDFQAAYDLETSGTPTPETIFWLFSGADP